MLGELYCKYRLGFSIISTNDIVYFRHFFFKQIDMELIRSYGAEGNVAEKVSDTAPGRGRLQKAPVFSFATQHEQKMRSDVLKIYPKTLLFVIFF